jgi:hypothetical protein
MWINEYVKKAIKICDNFILGVVFVHSKCLLYYVY